MDLYIGITGKNGFIGSSVKESLLAEGHHVISLDKYLRSFAPNNFTLHECPRNLDWVLHFAAKTSIQASIENPFTTYLNNLESTILALKIAHSSGASFLFMSSYVYGHPQYLPINEKHPTNPVNPYMGSKIAGEEICRQLCGILNIPLIILRGFNIYGASKMPGRLISDLLEACRKGLPIVINDPLPKRDYLYIKDFEVLVLKNISEIPIIEGTYNVSYGLSYSNIEVAEMVHKLSNNKNSIVVKSCKRSNDISDCTVDVSLIKRTFSWLPTYPLYDGLSELIAAELVTTL